MGANDSYLGFDDDDDDEPTRSSDPLADLPEPARKAMRRQAKQLKEATDALAKYQARERTASIAEVLTEKGLPAKVANLLPSDLEPTPDAVSKWLEDYADVFGVKQEGDSQSGSSQPPAGLTESDLGALDQIQSFNAGSATNDALPTTLDGVDAAIKATTSREQLEQLMAQLRARGL